MRPDEDIIRYLSGEMAQDEAEAFRQAMAGDKELQDSFENYSLAWKLMGDRLREKDEDVFRKKLGAIVKENTAPGPVHKSGRRWWICIPAAAAVILLAVLLFNESGKDRLYQQYCHPADDLLVEAMLQSTRGIADEQLLLYREGRYSESMERGMALLEEGQNEDRILLFTLLTALEINAEAEVLPFLQRLDHDTGYPLGQALCWYHAMALLKTGEYELSKHLLSRLEGSEGPYEKAAHKLTLRMNK